MQRMHSKMQATPRYVRFDDFRTITLSALLPVINWTFSGGRGESVFLLNLTPSTCILRPQVFNSGGLRDMNYLL